MNKKIDWKAETERAATLTDRELADQIMSFLGSLDAADQMDRATGEDRGGWMRDKLSVLRSEQRRRARNRRVNLQLEVGTPEFEVLQEGLLLLLLRDENYAPPLLAVAKRLLSQFEAAKAAKARSSDEG